MDPKFLFFILSFLLTIGAFVPYLRDMFRGETKPHVYTWLIWAITTSIGAAGVWEGDGGLPAYTFTVSAMLTSAMFFFSLRYGTKNITRGDMVALIAALIAVFVWIGLNSPVWSVIIGISIDVIGYIPSVRKTFAEPWSESVPAWIAWILAPVFSFLALETYNPLTVLYYLPIAIVNTLFIVMMLVRRKQIPKPA